MPAIENAKFGEIYKSSMANKHTWAQFVKACQKVVPGIEEKTLKQKFNYLKGLGLSLKEFEGQKGERGRGASTDYNDLAKIFGVKFDQKVHDETKARQKAAAAKAKATKEQNA